MPGARSPGARAPDAEQALLPGSAARTPAYGSAAPEDGATDMADVVESFGLRYCHVRLLVVAWVLLLCPSSIIMAIPYVLDQLRTEYGVDNAAAALVGSASTFGAVLGVLSFGRLHDMVGRRAAHLFAIIFICGCSALHLLLPVPDHPGTHQAWKFFGVLLGLRLVLGILFAGPASFAALYLIEFLPSQLRGFILTVCSAGWSLGTLYAIWVASACEGNWRLTLAAPVPVCFFAFLCLSLSPESPRWLYVVGRWDEGRSVLDLIFSSRILVPPAVDNPLTAPPKKVRVCSKGEEGANSQRPGRDVWRDLKILFSQKLRRTLMSAAIMQMAVNATSYTMLIWSAVILKQLLGVDKVPYELFVYSEFVGFAGTAVTACSLDVLGRKVILLCALISTAICTWGLAVVPRTYSAITATFLTLSFVGGGIWPAMTTYTNECFPTALRGTGGAFCQALGRGSAVLFPVLIGVVLDNRMGWAPRLPPLDTSLCITAGVSVLGAVGAALIPVETANAKMEDI